jgi:hypothetical protein
MAAIPALLFAAVDALFTRRDVRTIAKEARVELPDLKRVCREAYQKSWQGRYALALTDPHFRPDLFAILNHLARMEKLIEELMAQYQYARQTCDYLRSLERIDPHLIIKADSLAFRMHQSASRALRDMQKLEIRLEKAESNPPQNPTTPVAKTPVSHMASGGRERPETAPPDNPDRASAPTASAEGAASPAANPQPPVPDSPPTQDEFSSILVKHRHRIKDTPAKDRPALIARLIQQERVIPEQTEARAA